MVDCLEEIKAQLDDILITAQATFGKRNLNYTISIASETQNTNWGSVDFSSPEEPKIYLTNGCRKQEQLGMGTYLLAYEVIHCLRPIMPFSIANIKVLEEGMATWFGREYVHKIYNGSVTINNLGPNYETAYDLYKRFHDLFQGCIFNILNAYPNLNISEITADHIVAEINKTYGGMQPEYWVLIKALLLNFY